MGQARARVINDGTIKFDAGSFFGAVPKTLWETRIKVDRRNRIKLGLNCLFAEVGSRKILIDTGMGYQSRDLDHFDAFGGGISRLLKGLKANAIQLADITDVILTHGHPDHAGGIVRLDRAGALVPRFRKATIHIQRKAYEDALAPDERCVFPSETDTFGAVADRLNLLDGDTEIYPGINTILTHGHVPGHQVVMLQTGGERILHLGDLVPTPYHLNLNVMSAFDDAPRVTLDAKRSLINAAAESGWLLVFGHGQPEAAGYLTSRDRLTCLQPINL